MYISSIEGFKSYIDSLAISSDEQLMIMVGDKSAESVNELMSYLNNRNIKFFGGIFAGLLVGRYNRREGYVVEKVAPVFSTLTFPFMMRCKLGPEELSGTTAILLADGLSGRMRDLADTVYEKLGKNVTYVGGGAGFYDMEHRECIFDNKGIYKDALYVCILRSEARLAVKHGWRKLQGPFYVRNSSDNIISEIDDDTAFGIYKYVIEQEERITITKEDFFTYAKDHPFGILQEDGSVVVRDPISVNEKDEIVCVADIPQGSDVYILKGDVGTLLNSSLHIAQYCAEYAPEKYKPLLFNCISRAMFMQEQFEEELSNIQSRLKYEVQGALSIGEFASKPNGEMVIHNKSTVLALLP